MSSTTHRDEDRAGGPEKTGEAETGREETGREETQDERADRQWGELIQEIRIAQTGVQIMFGFLLTVVFTPRFADLSETDTTIYLITVVLGAAATGALIGPVALHRVLSGRRIKPRAVMWASRLTVTGLSLLLATLVNALLLILRVATHNHLVPWIVSGVFAWYLFCWLFLPLWAGREEKG